MQNCAILRHTLQSGLGTFPYEKHAMQRNENLRNSLGLNYKSAPLSGELRAENAATLYLSAVGAASVSPLLPSIALFQLLTFWPKSKETG
jgi:hypothetical protein